MSAPAVTRLQPRVLDGHLRILRLHLCGGGPDLRLVGGGRGLLHDGD